MGSKWMVDCNGTKGEGNARAMRQALQDLDFKALIEKQGGLATAVQTAITEAGYSASDRGGGDGSWHIGVPFEKLDDAVAYLDLMTTRFRKAVAAGMLRFALKTWSTSNWQEK